MVLLTYVPTTGNPNTVVLREARSAYLWMRQGAAILSNRFGDEDVRVVNMHRVANILLNAIGEYEHDVIPESELDRIYRQTSVAFMAPIRRGRSGG